jgi:hypothetical protein
VCVCVCVQMSLIFALAVVPCADTVQDPCLKSCTPHSSEVHDVTGCSYSVDVAKPPSLCEG